MAPAIGTAHHDAELIARCGKIHRLQTIREQWNADEISEEEGDAANTELWEHLLAITPMRARTAAGVKAKAVALVTVRRGERRLPARV